MLRARLVLGLVSLLLLLAAVGTYAVWTARQLGREVTAEIITHSRGLVAARFLQEQTELMSGHLRRMRSGDAVAARRDYADVRSRFMAALQEQSALAGSPARQEMLAGVAAAMDRVQAQVDSTGLADLRPLELMKQDEGAVFALLRAIEQLSAHDTAALAAAEAAARIATVRTTTVFATGVVLAVLLAGFFAWTTSRALLGPIRQLTDSALALGEGRLDREVPVTSRDELGELARTFNTMAAHLRSYRDAMTAKARRAQRTMEATLTSAPDPLFVVDADGNITVRNPAADALTNLPDFSEGLPESIRRPLGEVLATGEHYLPTDYAHVVTVRDRHYLPRILAIGDKLAEFRGAAVILQDVTKFRLLDDAKSNLVGTVSHELKTPLTSLRLSVYLLLEEKVGELSATQRELLETARDDADRLLRILNDLLDLTRLETGALEPALQTVEAPALLAAMAREIKPITETAAQTVTVLVADDVPATLRVDPDSIRHVFINLLGNASKYSGRGTAIELYAEPADEGYVRFGVRDSGPGLAEESLGRVFDKFYRAPGQEQKGVGLGLAIAREVVVAHGGAIACANRPGGGCDFHFLLPVREFTSQS